MTASPDQDHIFQDLFVLNGFTYSIIANPDSHLPYALWTANPDGSHSLVNTYPSLEQARLDLLQCALNVLPDTARDELVYANVTEDMRAAIIEQGREEVYLADIESCLQDALTHLGCDSATLPLLMEDQEFRTRALHLYHRQDHSFENEALTETLEGLIHDHYSDLLPKEFTAVLKISPEELEIQNDILTMTLSELEQKYGAIDLGEGMLCFYQQIKSPAISVEMEINIYPKPVPEEENRIEARIFTGSNSRPWTRVQLGATTLTDVKSIEQIYSCTDDAGIRWQLDLHADERLRRIGRQFIFRTDSDDFLYEQHNGQQCTVDRQLTPQEADMLCSNMMWKVRFEDGTILDAFDNELSLPREVKWDLEVNPEQQKPRQSTSLNQKIDSAEEQRNRQIEGPSEPRSEQDRL